MKPLLQALASGSRLSKKNIHLHAFKRLVFIFTVCTLLQSAYYLIKPASASSIQMRVELPTQKSPTTIRYTFIRSGVNLPELKIPFVLNGTASRNNYFIRINSMPNDAQENVIVFTKNNLKATVDLVYADESKFDFPILDSLRKNEHNISLQPLLLSRPDNEKLFKVPHANQNQIILSYSPISSKLFSWLSANFGLLLIDAAIITSLLIFNHKKSRDNQELAEKPINLDTRFSSDLDSMPVLKDRLPAYDKSPVNRNPSRQPAASARDSHLNPNPETPTQQQRPDNDFFQNIHQPTDNLSQPKPSESIAETPRSFIVTPKVNAVPKPSLPAYLEPQPPEHSHHQWGASHPVASIDAVDAEPPLDPVTEVLSLYSKHLQTENRIGLRKEALAELKIKESTEQSLIGNSTRATQLESVRAGGSYLLFSFGQRLLLVPSFQTLKELQSSQPNKGVFSYDKRIGKLELIQPAELKDLGDGTYQVVTMGLVVVPQSIS